MIGNAKKDGPGSLDAGPNQCGLEWKAVKGWYRRQKQEPYQLVLLGVDHRTAQLTH